MPVGIYELTDTWDAAGTTYFGIKMDVTDTAHAAGSTMLDLKMDGASKLALIGDLVEATGNEAALDLAYTVNKATSGTDGGLVITKTDTASPGVSSLIQAFTGATEMFAVSDEGTVFLPEIVTPAANVTGMAQLWISSTDSEPFLTDDGGVDWLIRSGFRPITSNGNKLVNAHAIDLDDATGDEEACQLTYTVNKATSGDVRGLQIYQATTAAPGESWLLSLEAGSLGDQVARFDDAGAMWLKERSAAGTDTAAYGQIWVKTGTPNTLWFTDDAGTDAQLGAGGGGAFTETSGLITPTATILLDAATGNEIGVDLSYTVNKATSGDDTGILVNKTDTASPGTSLFLDYQVAGVSKFRIDGAGDVMLSNDTHIFRDTTTAGGLGIWPEYGGDGLLHVYSDNEDAAQAGPTNYERISVGVDDNAVGRVKMESGGTGTDTKMVLSTVDNDIILAPDTGTGGSYSALEVRNQSSGLGLQLRAASHTTEDGNTDGGYIKIKNYITLGRISDSLTIQNTHVECEVRLRRCSEMGITASTTQTQGNGALTNDVNQVATVANANDTVTLPSITSASGAGNRVTIINNGANTLQVFPASGDDLGAGPDASTTIAAGDVLEFMGIDATTWTKVNAYTIT